MVPDKETGQLLVPVLEIIQNDKLLRQLAQKYRTLAQHQSAERIVDEIVKIIDGK